MATVTSAGRHMGAARRHSICQSVAPSTFMDSKSSLGTSRRKFVRMSTEMGMAKAAEGRMSAHRVSYRPICTMR